MGLDPPRPDFGTFRRKRLELPYLTTVTKPRGSTPIGDLNTYVLEQISAQGSCHAQPAGRSTASVERSLGNWGLTGVACGLALCFETSSLSSRGRLRFPG